MKRGDILDAVKHTITKERNSQHGEPENSFPKIAEVWTNYLRRHGWTGPEGGLKPSETAEMLAEFKTVRLETPPHNPDSEHDRLGYYAIAAELRAIENAPDEPDGMPGQVMACGNRIQPNSIRNVSIEPEPQGMLFNKRRKIEGVYVNRVVTVILPPSGVESEIVAVMNEDHNGKEYHDFYMWNKGKWLKLQDIPES